jgi:hypothetical protein
MASRQRIYDLLDGDPYSYQRRQDVSCGVSARYVLRLNRIPANVAQHVTSRIAVRPFDWWWIPHADATGRWIEISIREEAVLKLIQPETS